MKQLKQALIVTAIVSLWATAFAADLPVAKPGDVGMDAATLAQIPVKMKELVANKRIAGAVTVVLRKGKVVEHDAVGMADIENNKPMRRDSVFWIASMTKPIVSTSVMILVDEGKLSLDDPASKYIPQFKSSASGGLAKLKNGQPPAREITIRDLLSHTSGLAQPNRQPMDMSMPLAQYAQYLIRNPLNFEPGSAYEYGFGLTVAGRIVEIVSGKPYDTFLDERIFKPLGMNDTTFHPNVSQRARFAKTYKQDAQKNLAPAICHFATADVTIRAEPEPSGGLFSTAQDYAKFFEMVRSGGELNGARILSKQAVDEMTKPHIINGQPLAYGLGWAQVRRPANATGPRLEGFGHGGAFSTNGMIDPQKEIVTVLMIQRTLFDNGGDVLNAFQELVVKSLESNGAGKDSKVIATGSGLKYEELAVGTGKEAGKGDKVSVHYVGSFPDGKKFDSSRDRGQPFEFTLGVGMVIKGFDEGIAGMKVGGKRKLTIPSDLGYGDRGAPPTIPPKATLIFEVELLGVA